MNFAEKRDAALALLHATGMLPSSYAPPLYKALWKLGVEIPPPHFASFAANTALCGTVFGAIWGVVMWLITWSGKLPGGAAVAASLFAGLMFGAIMAAYYRHTAQKHGIPAWCDFHPPGSPPPI